MRMPPLSLSQKMVRSPRTMMSKLGERVWWWWRATTMALALSPKFTDHSARARLDWLSLSSLVATPLEEAESELKPKASHSICELTVTMASSGCGIHSGKSGAYICDIKAL